MAYNDFFSNEFVLKIIDDLNNDNAKLERVVSIYQDDITIYGHYLEPFNKVTGKGEDYILEILKNEYKDFYTYIHHLASESPPNSDIMVPVNLILYTMIKHFPRKLGKYFSLQGDGKRPRMVEMMIDDYNEIFHIKPSYGLLIKKFFTKLRRHYVFHKDGYILYRLIKKIPALFRYKKPYMTEQEILFQKFAQNIHYTTGTPKKGYPKLDKKFFKLIPKIMKIQKPFTVSEEELQPITWGLNLIAMHNIRTNIVKDFVKVLDKFKMPQMQYEICLGLSLRISLYTKDAELEEMILNKMPEQFTPVPEHYGPSLYTTLAFNSFVYYYMKGKKEKAEEMMEALVKQNKDDIKIYHVSDEQKEKTHKIEGAVLHVSDEQKEEMQKIIDKIKSKN